MLKKLIQEGKDLGPKAESAMVGKFFDSIDFEKWATKVALFFETNYEDSVVGAKIRTSYGTLNSNTNYNFYQVALGALEAIKENDDTKENKK